MGSRFSMRQICLLLILGVLCVFQAQGNDDSLPWRPDAPKLVLATMVMQEVDTGAALFIAIDRFDQTPYVDLHEFAVAARLLLETTESGWQLVTPIGRASIGRDLVRYLEQSPYVAVPLLAEKLASDITFDEREFSLVMKPAWPARGGGRGTQRSFSPTPVSARCWMPKHRMPACRSCVLSCSIGRSKTLRRLR